VDEGLGRCRKDKEGRASTFGRFFVSALITDDGVCVSGQVEECRAGRAEEEGADQAGLRGGSHGERAFGGWSTEVSENRLEKKGKPNFISYLLSRLVIDVGFYSSVPYRT
jgi:hypothetical protein